MYKLLFTLIFLSLFSCKDKIPCIVKITKQGIFTNEKNSTPISGLGDEKTTVFVFVRHAEKSTEPKDNPVLSVEGMARAVKLAQILKELDVYRAAVTSRDRKSVV